MMITETPSLIGRWRIEKVILADELFYDRNDTTITKTNFLERQRRGGEATKRYFDITSRPFSFDTFNSNSSQMSMQFFENGEFEFTTYYADSKHIEKGQYAFLAEKDQLLLTEEGVTDALTIRFSESSMELTSITGAIQSNYIYSKVQ
jgi:hypothetical protein